MTKPRRCVSGQERVLLPRAPRALTECERDVRCYPKKSEFTRWAPFGRQGSRDDRSSASRLTRIPPKRVSSLTNGNAARATAHDDTDTLPLRTFAGNISALSA